MPKDSYPTCCGDTYQHDEGSARCATCDSPLYPSPAPKRAPCTRCGEERSICCGDFDSDGNPFNNLCPDCCGPHAKFNPQRTYYPQ